MNYKFFERKYFQQRSAACEKTAASQKGNQQDAWQDRGERLYSCAAACLFQGQPCQSGDRPGKRKEAV